MKNWKSTGSLLWVNGLRARFSLPPFPTADGFRRQPVQERRSFRMYQYNNPLLGVLMSLTAQASSKTFEIGVELD